jgi:hypothetical protein
MIPVQVPGVPDKDRAGRARASLYHPVPAKGGAADTVILPRGTHATL